MYFVAGCGVTPITENAIALDINWAHLEKSRESSPCTEYVQGDLRNLPFRDAVFGRILCWNVLEHVSEKEAIISELHRVGTEGATVEISAGLQGCDQLLGWLSPTYGATVTKGQHQWAAQSSEYLELVAPYFEVQEVRYPCSAYVFSVVLLLDLFGVDFDDAGQCLGAQSQRVLLIGRLVSPFLQPLFNALCKRYRERLSQTVELRVRKRSSKQHLAHATVLHGSQVSLGAHIARLMVAALRKLRTRITSRAAHTP